MGNNIYTQQYILLVTYTTCAKSQLRLGACMEQAGNRHSMQWSPIPDSTLQNGNEKTLTVPLKIVLYNYTLTGSLHIALWRSEQEPILVKRGRNNMTNDISLNWLTWVVEPRPGGLFRGGGRLLVGDGETAKKTNRPLHVHVVGEGWFN